jgi:hypothetical protein
MPKYLGMIMQLLREIGILEVLECSSVLKLHCLCGTMVGQEF